MHSANSLCSKRLCGAAWTRTRRALLLPGAFGRRATFPVHACPRGGGGRWRCRPAALPIIVQWMKGAPTKLPHPPPSSLSSTNSTRLTATAGDSEQGGQASCARCHCTASLRRRPELSDFKVLLHALQNTDHLVQPVHEIRQVLQADRLLFGLRRDLIDQQ
jgi:hypothetical protein